MGDGALQKPNAAHDHSIRRFATAQISTDAGIVVVIDSAKLLDEAKVRN